MLPRPLPCFRNHARDNPSLPKPLEEPSVLDLLPRLRTRGTSKGAKESEELSPATAGDSVSTSSENRGETLAAAAAALLRQANPAAAQTAAAVSAAASEARDSSINPARRYEASKSQQQPQSWGGSLGQATVPAAASRVATTTTRATYSGSSTERCSPHAEEEGETDFAPAADWSRKDSSFGGDPLASLQRGRTSPQAVTGMGMPAPGFETNSTSPCQPRFPAFYAAQQLASGTARALPVQDPLEAPV